MACRVLAFVWGCTMAMGLAAGAPLPGCGAKQPGISASAKADIQKLQYQTTNGSFYKELVREFGAPLSCRMEVARGVTGITYAFRRHAELIARMNPEIETSEERMQVPRMPMTKALQLLKAAEQEGYGAKGCGIVWDHPAESTAKPDGSRETVYEGTSCNCKARVISRDKYVLSLALTSAC